MNREEDVRSLVTIGGMATLAQVGLVEDAFDWVYRRIVKTSEYIGLVLFNNKNKESRSPSSTCGLVR